MSKFRVSQYYLGKLNEAELAIKVLEQSLNTRTFYYYDLKSRERTEDMKYEIYKLEKKILELKAVVQTNRLAVQMIEQVKTEVT